MMIAVNIHAISLDPLTLTAVHNAQYYGSSVLPRGFAMGLF